jgi:hypothetical protein
MKNRWMCPIALVVFAACGGDSDERAAQKEFEVVQEGSASGVTSTIAGPGEQLPPITGTNADTTTAFTIDPNAVSAAPAPGTLAGTLPPPSYPSQPAYVPPSSPSPSYTPRAEPERAMTSSAPAPAQPQPQAPPTDTTTTQQPPATDTTATPPPQQTQTAPAPAQPEQEQEEPEEAEEEPPPPPTTTDTRGQ